MGNLHEVQASKWIIAVTVSLATFIEVMDTSVVNVSLPHIQGSLNAGVDEVTWVLTSYLVSNAIIIPITGWLASLFGRKRYFMFSLALFTASSLLCGIAPSLRILVVARIIQGLGGGGLVPIAQAILLESFPIQERGVAMAIFGMVVVFAPISMRAEYSILLSLADVTVQPSGRLRNRCNSSGGSRVGNGAVLCTSGCSILCEYPERRNGQCHWHIQFT